MTDDQVRLREALKRVAVTLKQADVPFALAGGYALWARGAPEPHHDVDFLVAEDDREQLAGMLTAAGIEVVDAPEDWLVKLDVQGAMVDLLHRQGGVPVTHDDLRAVDEMEVESVRMPVLDATRLVQAKLAALDERDCDLGKVLPAARSVREQVDWDAVARAVAANPFAAVTLDLLHRLGVLPVVRRPPDAEPPAQPGGEPGELGAGTHDAHPSG